MTASVPAGRRQTTSRRALVAWARLDGITDISDVVWRKRLRRTTRALADGRVCEPRIRSGRWQDDNRIPAE